MDVKTGFSAQVKNSKSAAEIDKELNRAIIAGEGRKETYSKNWSIVDINDIVERFTPNVTPKVEKGKVRYKSIDGRYEILADIGGGYLRIFDHVLKCNVDAFGNDVRNYTDENGKQHGRAKSKQRELTHFRIKKREEMK